MLRAPEGDRLSKSLDLALAAGKYRPFGLVRSTQSKFAVIHYFAHCLQNSRVAHSFSVREIITPRGIILEW